MCTLGRRVRSADLGLWRCCHQLLRRFRSRLLLVLRGSLQPQRRRSGFVLHRLFIDFMVQPNGLLAHEPEGEGGKGEKRGKWTDAYLFRGAAALVFALTATL